MAFYYLTFCNIMLLNFFSKKVTRCLLVYCGVILFVVAAFRNSNVDRDYLGYIRYFDLIISGTWANVEPSFILICKMLDKFVLSSSYIFIIYALFGVSIKIYAINKLANYKLLSVLVYFSNYFLFQELTQIRAGVASGIFLLCVPAIKEKNIYKFIILSVLAIFFHYSAIIILFFYLLKPDNINTKVYFLLIPIAYLLFFANIDVLSYINFVPVQLIQLKFTDYSTLTEKVNIFNALHITRCLLGYIFLWKWRLIKESNPYAVIMIKIYLIAIFLFMVLANAPGINSRLSELLMIVEIILIPSLINIFNNKKLAIGIVICIAFAFLTFDLYYVNLLNSYFS